MKLLSFTARVIGNCSRVMEALALLYPTANRASNDSAVLALAPFAVVQHDQGAGYSRFTLSLNGGEELSFASALEIVAHLECEINAAAAKSLGGHLLIHAGAVATPAGVVVIPGPSGAGKSTLVAAMSLSGFGYLSDEIAMVDSRTLAALPFLKPIGLKDGGWRTLAASFELPPALRAVRSDGEIVHYIPAPQMFSVSRGLHVGFVVLPARRAGAAANLRSVSRAHAVAELARHSLNLPRHGLAGVETLAQLTETAECYMLTYDDLPEAVAALAALVHREDAPLRRARRKSAQP